MYRVGFIGNNSIKYQSKKIKNFLKNEYALLYQSEMTTPSHLTDKSKNRLMNLFNTNSVRSRAKSFKINDYKMTNKNIKSL